MKINDIVALRFAIRLSFTGLILMACFSIIGCDGKRSGSKEEQSNKLEEQGDHVIKDAVKDIDGNSYDAVKLGDQVWMADNLKTTSTIKPYPVNIKNCQEWPKEPYYALGDDKNLNDDEKKSREVYYNVFAARSENICPKGWHVPSDNDWQELMDYLTSQPKYSYGNSETNIAKSLASKKGWRYYTEPTKDVSAHVGCNPVNTNNSTEFDARPMGYIKRGVNYAYRGEPLMTNLYDFGCSARYWTATPTELVGLVATPNHILSLSWDSPLILFLSSGRVGAAEEFVPIRCVKN